MTGGGPELDAGTILAGKIRIVRRLGSGGMGTVYEAVNEAVDRPVAVKVLRTDLATDPGFATRFKREAKATGRLRHANVVDVFDFGVDEGHAYLVMELLEGETLGARIEERAPLPVAEAIAILDPVLRAVRAAHEAGIVHRDLKPENLFLSVVPGRDAEVPKVLDFGVAKIEQANEERLTATRTSLGTAAYMAPEQVRSSRDVGPAADQYAVAVVLYEVLTGALPHSASSYNEMIVAKIVEAPRDLAEVRPDLPAALAALVMRALAVEPSDRHADLEAFRVALAEFAAFEDTPPAREPSKIPIDPLGQTMDSGERPSLPMLASEPTAAAPEGTTPSVGATMPREARLSMRHPAVWATLLAVLTAVVGYVGFANRTVETSRADAGDGVSPQAGQDFELPIVLRLTEDDFARRRTRLTSNPADRQITGSAIDPSGRYLAYCDVLGLHILDIDRQGGRAALIASPEGVRFLYAEWSPEGDVFLVTTRRAGGERGITWIDYNERQPRPFQDAAWSPVWSPVEGGPIAYLDADGVHVMDRSGAHMHLVYRRRDEPEEGLSSLVWSPDGSYILAASRYGHETPRLRILNAEAEEQTLDEREVADVDVNGMDPVWHRDGFIIYTEASVRGERASMKAIRTVDGRFEGDARAFPGCIHDRCFVSGASADGLRLVFEAERRLIRAGVAELGRDTLGPLSFPMEGTLPQMSTDLTNDALLAMVATGRGFSAHRLSLSGAGATDLGDDGFSFPTETADGTRALLVQQLEGDEDEGSLAFRLVSRDLSSGRVNPLVDRFEEPETNRYVHHVPYLPPHTRRYDCNEAFGCVLSVAAGEALVFSRLDPVAGPTEELHRMTLESESLPYMWRFGTDSRITLVVHRDTDWGDVQVIDLADGTQTRFETSDECRVHSVQLLGDGALLAVCRPAIGGHEWRLVRYRESGAAPEALWASDSLSMFQPLASPDGSRLAATFTREEADIFVLDARGLAEEREAADPLASP